jgi:hypothetical protein
MVVWLLWLHITLADGLPIVQLAGAFKTQASCEAEVKKLKHDSKSWADCAPEQVQP